MIRIGNYKFNEEFIDMCLLIYFRINYIPNSELLIPSSKFLISDPITACRDPKTAYYRLSIGPDQAGRVSHL